MMDAMSVQSVERAFGVLDALANGPLGVTDVSLRVDLPKSTVARLLKTLEELGAVERVIEDGRYRIGSVIGSLAGSTRQASDLVARARPVIEELCQDIGEDVGFSVPEGYLVHYIDQVDSDNAVQVRDWTGEEVPMHAVPSGLVMLAHWPSLRLERYLNRPLVKFTESTMIDPDTVAARLEVIRDKGFAWVFEEFVEGINSVASPVLDRAGRPLGAVHVHGPAYRFPEDYDRDVVTTKVVEAAERLSDRLQRHQY